MKQRSHKALYSLIAVVALLLTGCGTGDASAGLYNLQLVGVDYQLNSVWITNNGGSDVKTEGLWMYQNGEAVEFQIFTIEPRAIIQFSLRDVGGADLGGGELALFAADSFSDPDALVDYVAWGRGGHDKAGLAAEARLWSSDEFVDVDAGAILILKTDPAGIGASAWSPEGP